MPNISEIHEYINGDIDYSLECAERHNLTPIAIIACTGFHLVNGLPIREGLTGEYIGIPIYWTHDLTFSHKVVVVAYDD